MAVISELAKSCVEPNFREIYKIIDARLQNVKYTADGTPMGGLSHTSSEVDEIKHHQFDAVKSAHIAEFGAFKTLADEHVEAARSVKQAMANLTKDGFANPVTGFGTSIDPSMAGYSYTPILASPEESTSMYASGGLAKIIVDKKSKGVLLNGYSIKSSLFTAQQLKELQEYADSLGFNDVVSDLLRDGNVYGGAVLFPTLAGDNPLTMGMTLPQLYQNKLIGKNCIRYFSVVDRWNTVVVPNYDICAQDYMNPRTLYVPIAGIEVHSDRISRGIPNRQPYWSAIRNLGWGMSDFVSYARSLIGYELMAVSLPIMCQQMSLLVHQLPLDGIIAQNGPDAARKWQKANEEELRNWSILNPKAINTYGQFTVVNRTYAGFNNLIDAIRKDVSAKCGIPESVIFFSQPNGIFNKNEEDVLLKQSETIRLVQRTVAPSLGTQLVFLAASLWGANSWDDIARYQTLQIDFDTPVISSPSQKAEIGFKYASAINTLVSCGISVESALGIAEKIIGEVELPSDFNVVLQERPIVQAQPIRPTDNDATGGAAYPRAGGRNSV